MRYYFTRSFFAISLLFSYVSLSLTTVSARTPAEPIPGFGDIGSLLMSMMIPLVLFLGVLGFYLFIAVWSYNDASARGWESPALAPILILGGGLIGLIIYLKIRP
ncbi:MAG: hypothetical protein KAH57_10560 [Thermoplasmata archaeon]|nr:hypothetical protein [Thermoplasmata archaeon]